jgi:uncharacterized protein (TIGR03382 family)
LIGTTCGPAPSCTDGVAKPASACNGTGACTTPAPAPCDAYACGATACNTTCTQDTDCALGYSCNTATSACVRTGVTITATCDGDHTTTSPTGEATNCAPFKCESNGTCKIRCGSIDDCAAPAACDPDGKCVAAAPPSDDSGGCSTSPLPPLSTSATWAALALAALLLRSRRYRSRSWRPLWLR